MSQMSRSGLAGPPASLTAGLAFGVPPLLKFGSRQLQERLLPDLLTCKKRTCLAITEPDAGSDVANITTTAAKSADGRHYIINGSKKWWVGFLLFSKAGGMYLFLARHLVRGLSFACSYQKRTDN